MEIMGILIKAIILLIIIGGISIFVIRRALFSSTEGAVKRLNDEIAKANAKQAELSKKLREADEELEKRRVEAREVTDKMRTEAEEETKSEKEKIITKARAEGEEIIAKAQNARIKMQKELEKEMDVKAIKFGVQILNSILSEKAKGALNEILINEFLAKLKDIDMSRISPDVKTAEIISLSKIDDKIQSEFLKIIKEKLSRDISITVSEDPNLGGGAILKFGSMALDGSIQNLIRESALEIQQAVEARQI